MNKQCEFKYLFCVLAIGFIVHSANSFSLAQTNSKTGYFLSDKKSARRQRETNVARHNLQRVTHASFQSEVDPTDPLSQEQLSSEPDTFGNQTTSNARSNARDMRQPSPAISPVKTQENIEQNGGVGSPSRGQFREDYEQHYQSLRPVGGNRFSTDLGANLSGAFSSPSPRMAATEMVVNQAAKIAMLEKMIVNYQAENSVLKNELTLTINALTQTNLAFNELQTQMISVNQQNRSLRVKFQELADTYSRSETEIQQMLNQLRQYVSKELNAANVLSGSRSTNQFVEPGALPNSELLPPPKN